MLCKEKTVSCVSLGPGGFIPDTFLENGAGGYCLQELFRGCLGATDAEYEGYIHAWAAQFDVGIDARSILEYRWNRDGSPILRTMYPHAMRSCAEVSFGQSEEGIGKRTATALRPFDFELINDTNALRELRATNALQYQNVVDMLSLSDNAAPLRTEALHEEIAALIRKHEDVELRLEKQIELNLARRRRYTEFWGIESELELAGLGESEAPAED
jgi:hypothetical protein